MKISSTILLILLVINGQAFAQPKLLGNISRGGDQFGLIFKYTAGDTLFSDTYHLKGVAGTIPGAITQVGNYIYGCTVLGGAFGLGTIYKYDPLTNVHTVLHDFIDSTGSQSACQLLLANNGKLYGTTRLGGSASDGVIFEFDLSTETYQKLAEFNYNVNGSHPSEYLIQASNGKIYGTTVNDQFYLEGSIFEFDIATNTITTLHNFNSATENFPYGKLYESTPGKLLGTTYIGGSANGGVIYEYDLVTNNYSIKVDFTPITGIRPTGSFGVLNSTTLLGTCFSGGNGAGTIFEYDITTNTLTKKFDFSQSLGGSPYGNLTLASNGKWYGGHESGGAHNLGGIFEYNYATNTVVYPHGFIISDGQRFRYPFVELTAGLLTGTNAFNGTYVGGVLFEYNITSTAFTKKMEFGSSDGTQFTGPLTLAANGKYYSGTLHGGINNKGVIFEYDYLMNSYSKKIDLSTVTGANSSGSLVHTPNGKLYGTTTHGGPIQRGILFEYDYNTNTCVKKIDFTVTNGGVPYGSMILASDGYLYGMSSEGGGLNLGVIYRYDYINNTIINKFEFDSMSGFSPFGALLEASNGKLYGMTFYGGINGIGTLFSFDLISNTFTKIYDFDPATGMNPEGSLLEISPGVLLGMAQYGGIGGGNIFEYNFTTGIVTPKYNFILAEGAKPLGTLFKASNGQIFGMTSLGGQNNTGTIFEFDPVANSYINKIDLPLAVEGWFPFSTFVEVDCLSPVITASGPLSFCLGDSVILSANGFTGSTYQWYRNGFLIPGANSASYTAKIPGRYYVNVSDPVCAISSNTPPVRVMVPCIPPLDEGEKQGSSISNENLFMYFSGINNELSLFAEYKGVSSLLITDAAGRVVLQKNYVSSGSSITQTIDCSELAKGLYIARLVAGEHVIVTKFIKGQ